MDPEIIEAIKSLGGDAAVTLVAAYAAGKAVLNGMRKDVAETRDDVKEMKSTLGVHGERLAALEARNVRKDT